MAARLAHVARKRLREGQGSTDQRGRTKLRKPVPQMFGEERLEEVLSRPVDSLKLGRLHPPVASRIVNTLRKNGIKTLRDLAGRTEDEIRNLRYMGGEKSIRVLKKEMEKLGITFEMEEGKEHRKMQALKTPVNRIGISTAASRLLRNQGIEYVYQLVQKSKQELLKLPGVDAKTIARIREYLKTRGLRLGMRFDLYMKVKIIRSENNEMKRKAMAEYFEKNAMIRKAAGDTLQAIKDVDVSESVPALIKALGSSDRALAEAVVESEVPEKQKATVREAVMVEVGMGLEELRELVEGANREVQKLSETVKSEVLNGIKQILDLFRFPPKPPEEECGARFRDVNPS